MTPIQASRPTSNDLWASAVAEMSEGDRKNINFSCPNKLGILSDLLQDTENSRKECDKKRWRYTRKSGERVILVDVFSKIVKWIDIFKQVGDAAVQYDPVHAALPWAGVRFLLQIAVSDIETFASVVESVNSIAEIICRYAIFEDLYLQSPSRATDGLQRALVKLYAAIMIYLSKARQYLEQNSAKRILKSSLLISEIEPYFDAIGTAQETVDRYSNMVEMQEHIDQHMNLKRLLECIDGPMQRLNADLESIKDGFESSKRTEILRWISPEPYIQHHQQAKKEVLQGTGEWLLSDPVFKKWKGESVSSILWLHGIQGSGKSKLVSIVIEDAKMSSFGGQSPPLAFFYCSRSTAEPTRSNPDSIVASIARQLSSLQPGDPLLPPVVAAYVKREKEGFASGSLSMEESCALILQLVEHYQLTTIVIDALDECDPQRWADLLEILEEILQESPRLVKIFVSSRDDQDIILHLRDYPNLELSSDKNLDDITTFVAAETHALIKRRKLLALSSNKESLKEEIIEQVTKGAQGMFRWASLQLQSLCDSKTDEAIQERLGRLPSKLEDLYLELYEKLTKESADADRAITINAFSWLLCAQKTLSSAEFLAALSVTAQRSFNKLTKEHVLQMCSNMIVLDSALDTFRFAHLSVREFLEKRPEYSAAQTNSIAAERCLLDLLNAADHPATRDFLSSQRQHLRDSALSHDIGPYAAMYWASHYELAADRRMVGLLKDLILHFLSHESDPRSAIVQWKTLIKREPRYPPEDDPPYRVGWRLQKRLQDTIAKQGTAFFIACCFDLPEIARMQTSVRKDIVNDQGQTGLDVAVYHGSCKMVSILINDKFTELEEKVVKAAAGNHRYGKEVMTVLLEQRGADVHITEEVVKAAAGNGESGKEVIALLLKQRGADVHITEGVVKEAAGNHRYGKEVMTVLLEQRGADVHITEEVVKEAAGNSGSGKEVMALLIEQRGADVHITEEVVKVAAGNMGCGKEVMTLLLEQRGADVHITEEVVKTVVGNSWCGKEVMELLLEQRGADIQITEEVVKVAAGNSGGGKEVMTLLLEQRGADVHITEGVIKEAAGNSGSGNEVMALLIEQRGADVHITQEVVKVAAGNMGRGKEVMTLLLEQRGADVHITEEVVKAAAQNGRSGKELIKLLLEQRGADVQITEEVVKAAAQNYNEEVIMLLLEKRGADVQITEEVVKAVARNYRKEVMMLLLEKRGADVQITEEVVKAAAGNSYGGKEVMMLLLQWRGADVHITQEVVKVAAGNMGCGKEMMTLLLEQRGADVQITEEVIKAAAQNYRKEVMMLLLEKRGADVQITEEVVKAAAGNSYGGKEVMTLLLERRGADVVITEEVVKAAARSGQEEVLILIEERLKTPVSEGQWQIAQFYNAAKEGKQDIIQDLLIQGVEPDLTNSLKESPLFIAARFGHLRVVELLLGTKTVDVNSQNIYRQSPINVAAANGSDEIVRLLLEAGADPRLVDEYGQTPISIAKLCGHDKIAKMLAGRSKLEKPKEGSLQTLG